MTTELAPGDTPRDLLIFNPRIRDPGKLALNHGLAKSSSAGRHPNYRESQFENVASRRQLPAQTMCRRLDRCAWQLAFKTIDARRQAIPL